MKDFLLWVAASIGGAVLVGLATSLIGTPIAYATWGSEELEFDGDTVVDSMACACLGALLVSLLMSSLLYKFRRNDLAAAGVLIVSSMAGQVVGAVLTGIQPAKFAALSGAYGALILSLAFAICALVILGFSCVIMTLSVVH